MSQKETDKDLERRVSTSDLANEFANIEEELRETTAEFLSRITYTRSIEGRESRFYAHLPNSETKALEEIAHIDVECKGKKIRCYAETLYLADEVEPYGLGIKVLGGLFDKINHIAREKGVEVNVIIDSSEFPWVNPNQEEASKNGVALECLHRGLIPELLNLGYQIKEGTRTVEGETYPTLRLIYSPPKI